MNCIPRFTVSQTLSIAYDHNPIERGMIWTLSVHCFRILALGGGGISLKGLLQGPPMAEIAATAESLFRDVLSEPRLRIGVQQVPDMPELSGLFGDCRDEVRMAMPQHARAKAAEEIKVPIAFGIKELAAPAFRECDLVSRIVERHELIVTLNDFLCGCHVSGLLPRRAKICKAFQTDFS